MSCTPSSACQKERVQWEREGGCLSIPSSASKRVLIALVGLGVLWLGSPAPAADESPPYDDEAGPAADNEEYDGVTPPRLSLADGEVSFSRSGADDWAKARVNTPLAAGDQLYTGRDSNLEIEIGPRAFVRAGPETQLALDSHEADYDQVRVSGGDVSLDARSVPPRHVIEIDTPHGAYTIERPGYYRVAVDDDSTTFTARRGGRATVMTPDGRTEQIEPSEQVVASDGDDAELESYAAPDLDAWDRWNYERSDYQLDARSRRYVPDTVAGVSDLDHYGHWRVVPTYGSVWVPSRVPVGWAPYSRGDWLYDPYYGWTWVDEAPWGWAPFHYGRWIFAGGFWAWAPGPIVARPIYAPALVAFLSVGPFTLGFGIGAPTSIGWIPLGWGEPCIPWWGPRGFVGHRHWFGWGGPRVLVEQHISVTNINVYSNARVPHAFVAVPGGEFGRRPVRQVRIADARPERMRFVDGRVPVRDEPARITSSFGHGQRPPRSLEDRHVYATRAPERAESQSRTRVVEPRRGGPERVQETRAMRPPPSERGNGGAAAAPERGRSTAVAPERGRGTAAMPERGRGGSATQDRSQPSERPPFGARVGAEREPPPAAPRYRETQQRTQSERAAARTSNRTSTRQAERPARALPGEPADRVYGGRDRVMPQTRSRSPEPRVRSEAAPQPRRSTTGGPRAISRPERAPRNVATDPAQPSVDAAPAPTHRGGGGASRGKGTR